MLAVEKTAERMVQCATTEQSCIDESIGELLYDYLMGDLTDAEEDVMDSHLDKCGYCQAGLINWLPITEVVKSLGNERGQIV